ncbi:MAG: C25 family cysteine peptidase, partial [candidate division WOR-3 bacterium]
MLYRGHGDVAAWANVSPSWTNSNVYTLTNGRMVPAVVAPTCLSGNFDEATDCHAEAWLKAGTPTEEKGGCAYFGSSEVSYSGYNDSLAAGTFFSYVDSLTYTYAQCTQWGKLFMLQAYPLPDEISEEEIYMFNNFGEPELNVWSATPRELTVSHPATVLIGSFLFPVTVMASGNPVADAQVCVMSTVDTTVFHVGHTNASGQIQFNLQTTLPGDTLLVTVTGRNLRPYLASVRTMAPNAAYVTYLKHLINDSAPGGNGDLIINPGETIKLPTWVKNWGAVTANSVTGTLRATDPNITILDSVKSFGNIPAGDSAFTGPAGYRFSVAAACTNGYVLRFTLRCRDALDSVWNSSINLFVGTPVLHYASKTVNDPPPGGNGDGKLDPGETAQLLVTLRNIGLGHGYNVAARLRSGDHRLHALDSLASYGTIPKESTGTNTADPFILHADDSIPREAVISCTLLVTADGGYARTIPFTIVVGEIRTIDPIPDGPRQPPLYWAYDDVDSHYVQHPEFNWVEIRGLGTRLSLGDDETRQVNLPSGFGPWRYYGQSFSQISICSNGWVAAGYTTTTTYTNTSLPNSAMPPMVCMNWDDLYPPSAPSNGGVWYYHDAANHRFIVEFDSVPYFSSRTAYESFELVIYDTTVTTPSGDNLMIAQYLTARGYSSSTVGLQDPSLTVAIQCLFDGSYHRGAAPIAAGRAIKFVTGSPQVGVTENELTGAEIAGLRLLVRPNPFQKGTTVNFSLPGETQLKLAVYDLSGRVVRTLAVSRMKPGAYTINWDGRDEAGRKVGQGIYILRLEADGKRLATKAVLLR